MFHKMFSTHPLVQPISVSYWGSVLLFTSQINHVFSALAPKPYIVRVPVCSLRMIRWMWRMIYRETCFFPLKPSLVYKPCSLTNTHTLSTLRLWRPGNLMLPLGGGMGGGGNKDEQYLREMCLCPYLCEPKTDSFVFSWTVLLLHCIMFQC